MCKRCRRWQGVWGVGGVEGVWGVGGIGGVQSAWGSGSFKGVRCRRCVKHIGCRRCTRCMSCRWCILCMRCRRCVSISPGQVGPAASVPVTSHASGTLHQSTNPLSGPFRSKGLAPDLSPKYKKKVWHSGSNLCTFHLDPSIVQRFAPHSARISVLVFLRL